MFTKDQLNTQALGVAADVLDYTSVARSGTKPIIMNSWMKNTSLIVRTRQGEIVLHDDIEFKYAFRFGSINQLLTAEQFHILHNSALSISLDSLSTKSRQPAFKPASPTGFMFTLFSSLTRSELLELQNLVSKAALLVTTLSNAIHSVN